MSTASWAPLSGQSFRYPAEAGEEASQRRSGEDGGMICRVLGWTPATTPPRRRSLTAGGGCNAGRLLEVRPGELGLRQSDALFQHVKQLPGLLGASWRRQGLADRDLSRPWGPAPGPGRWRAPTCPAFWRESARGGRWPHALGRAVFCLHPTSRGTWRRPPGPPGRLDLLDGPFLAWHLSGGTTELLLVRAGQGINVTAEMLGGTSDISAGQLIDRTGVLLGLQFPAGKALDEL